ncbi:rni-like superfamily protein [Anaeramoeba flamelloides]|uniref:Rni-like superfamily protein n=1 Tax=Anaeramoeba flamelloides TaxID=1746091 RepID=A0AAV7ZY24_9EUKA|nr:rni-like superfamily protein [Anaeramoeba flamelloides]
MGMVIDELSQRQKEEFKNDLQRLILNDQTFTVLTLNYQIGDEEMQALSESLKINQTLTYLCFPQKRIGTKSMQALGEALKVNQTLTHLFLNNRIGTEGMQALGEALKVNQTLTQLELSRNEIGDAAM